MTDSIEQAEIAETTPASSDNGSAGTGAFAGLGVFSGLGAVAAKSCCVLPLLLASSGLGGAWLSRELAAYRPYFLGIAWLALALAWGFALRRRRAACASGASCSSTARTVWISYGLLTLSTVVVVLATTWGRFEPALAEYIRAGLS